MTALSRHVPCAHAKFRVTGTRDEIEEAEG